jgi:hypothetical protein
MGKKKASAEVKARTRGGAEDLHKTLKIVSGGFDDWIGELVAVPASSVTFDATPLIFNPVDRM